MAKKENRVDVYLNPSQKIFIQSYSKITGESKSEIVKVAVTAYIKTIPLDIRNQINKEAKEK